MNRSKQDAVYEKRLAVESAESAGQVADSMEVRARLIAQMQSGEKTLAEIQAELAAIKRAAEKNAQLTRNQVYNRA